ncbi:ribosome maturation factor RimP [Algoriphagus confluentis]|uniref:Ribosome maturation factor RimP n=1 Tax=Algoriphagus confluentis TaxID=1697556 RepID=A0ABQ6PVB8_9BACT|nr:ribosome maturation factor RimP [Algoriphagus confluentis]
MGIQRHTIEDLAKKHLPDDSHFLVEVKMEENSGKAKIMVLIDADQGVTIDTCARVSRGIGEELEADESIVEAFVLEVSSPGLDYPLATPRQYQKNVGRGLRVWLQSGEEQKGKLSAVEEFGIKLLIQVKEKGKKAWEEELSLPYSEIKKSIVQVSFK